MDTSALAASRRATAAATILLLAACAAERPPNGHTEGELPPTAEPAERGAPADTAAAMSFTCDDMVRFTLLPREDSGTLILADTTLELERTAAATGTRYARAGVELWHDDAEATLTTPDATFTGCAAATGPDPWAAAYLRGTTFRAVGQEPGWHLDIGPQTLTFVGDYGERRLAAPAPEPQGDAEDTLTWHAHADGTPIIITARRADCRDIMSGEAFRYTVTVTTGTETQNGCGRLLNPPR